MAEKETKVLKADNKPKKAKAEKKKGRIKKAWNGFRSEFKKITWPSWLQVRKNTFVVIVVVIIAMIFIGGLDIAFSQGINSLPDLIEKIISMVTGA